MTILYSLLKTYRRLQNVCHREAKSWFRLLTDCGQSYYRELFNRIIHIRKAVAFSDFTFLLQIKSPVFTTLPISLFWFLVLKYMQYSASSLVCHFCCTFYSNCGRFAWFMTPCSADLPEIYYTGLLHLKLHV